MRVVLEADAPGGRPDPLSIADLYGQVDAALARVFPRNRSLWVRGEIQSVSDQPRTGHCYLDLVDPESARDRQAPVLRVKCWRTTWGPLRATLRREGIELTPGMVVMLRGTLDFYRPRAEIGFVLAELDVTSLLGRLAAQRAALLRTLAAEGLLDANRRVPVPAVPLRIGLVGSPGTEGFADFIGQIMSSNLAFRIQVAPVTVQGATAPRVIARGLAKAGPRGLRADRAGAGWRVEGRSGSVRRRGRCPRRRHLAASRVGGDRSYRRRVGHRHRRKSFLHHSHRMRSRADAAGEPVVGRRGCRIRLSGRSSSE